MLFTMAEGVVALPIGEATAPHVISALQRLLSSHWDGDHVVLLPRDVCESIESSSRFSEAHRNCAKKIRNRYADLGGLPSVLSLYASITDVGAVPQLRAHGWEVPLHWIASRPLQKASLICEDLYDISILENAAADHLYKSSLRSFSVKISHDPGGGGNSHRLLEKKAISDQIITVCVVDSDKPSPLGPLGATAQKCVGVAGDGLFELCITNGRSLENALPWRLVDVVYGGNPPPSTTLRQMELSYRHSTAYLFFKSGFRGFEITKLLPPCSVFWRAAIVSHAGAPTCCPAVCNAANATLCTYIFHAGFGRTLLGNVARWLESNYLPNRLTAYDPSENDVEWKLLGSKVASYGLGMPPTRS